MLRAHIIARILLVALGTGVFFTGIGWGLPSRRGDELLFGGRAPWTGEQIQQAAGPWVPDPHRGADVDQNPLAAPAQGGELNSTLKQQAEILRRYRLFSEQPDEMVTFMALSRLRRGNLDPGMYQYGGLWIYPIGMMLKIASIPGFVRLTPDLNYYLNRPEEFGRFYVVGRVFSAMWGLIGIATVYALAQRLGRGWLVPAAAAAGFLFMPVIVNAAHEAKPHLGGAVLVLVTVLFAVRFCEAGWRRDRILAGISAGAAAGIVLSGAVAGLVLIVMALLQRASWRERLRTLGLAGLVALVVFCVTNPFLPINLVRNPAVVRSNLGTLSRSKAVGGEIDLARAIPNAAKLVAEGASPVVAVVGLVAAVFLGAGSLQLRRSRGNDVSIAEESRSSSIRGGMRAACHPPRVLILLAAPALTILAQFTLLAANKSGEYGRFAILPDVLLLLLIVRAIGRFCVQPLARVAMAQLLVLGVAFFGMGYMIGFVENRTRHDAAELLGRLPHGARTIGIPAEPAPYNLPPIDFSRWKVILLPATGEISRHGGSPDVILRPLDDFTQVRSPPLAGYQRIVVAGRWIAGSTRISWANKPFEIQLRAVLVGARRAKSDPD